MNNKEIIYISIDEKIAYLIDKIEKTEGDDIYINSDKNQDFLKDLMNLKLLDRELRFLNKKATIISEDEDFLSYIKSNTNFDVLLEGGGEDDVESADKEEYEEIDFNENSDTEVGEGDNNIYHDHKINDIKQPDFLDKNNEVNHYVEHDTLKNEVNDISEYNDEDEADVFFEKTKKERRHKESKININTDIFKDIFSNNKKMVLIMGVLLLLVVVSSIFIFRPKADLNIIVKKETIDFTMPVSADINASGIDFENFKIPGQIIKLEKDVEYEFQATGASDSATKATGKITIYNEYGSESQPLVARTRFKTDDGKIYRITKRVVVPGAKMSGGKVLSPGVLDVVVVADEGGENYNIGPTTFKIPGFEGTPKYSGFYAKSVGSMTGGSSGDVKIITKEDLDNAKKEVEKKIKDEKLKYSKSKIQDNFVVLDGAIKENIDFIDIPIIGTATDKFKVKAKISYDVFVFEKEDASKVADKNLEMRIKKKRETYPDTQILSYEDPILSLDGNSLNFSIRVSEVVGGKINEKDLKLNLAGKDETDISKIISGNDSIESADITLWPFWSTGAPDNPNRININIIR